MIGQSGKYHTILQISVWVVLHVNPTSQISLGLCMICTCNASAPHNFAYTAHIQFVQNKQTNKLQKKSFHEEPPKWQSKEYYGIFCSGQLGERIQEIGEEKFIH